MNLNKEQSIVVNELERNVILLASAGTGKTETLAFRVANIIERGLANPEEVLCITFTNKAAKEMKERVASIVKQQAKNINIATFHSFCFDIIKMQAKKKTDLFTDFIVFDEDDCAEIIKTCNYYNFPIHQLQKFIDFVKLEKARRNIYSDDLLKDYEEVIKELFKEKEDTINNICSEKGNINIKLKSFLEGKRTFIY